MTAKLHPNAQFTLAQRRRAMRFWTAGKPAAEIAESIGCTVRTISNWARAAGLKRERRGGGRRYSDAFRARIVRMYVEDRRSVRWIEDVTGVSRYTVGHWVRAAGHTMRSVFPTLLDHEEVARVHAETGSTRATAERFGCTPSGVHSALRRALRMRVRAELEAAE